MTKTKISPEMSAFLQAEIHNCTAPNGSGEATTLATANGSLSQMPEEVLVDLILNENLWGRFSSQHN